jgi:hypothetical protein
MKEVLKLALNALERTNSEPGSLAFERELEAITAIKQALAAPAAPVRAALHDGWLQEGSLLYRLTDGREPQNRDEINVTMADGSRSTESRTRRAGELLDRIRTTPPAAAKKNT